MVPIRCEICDCIFFPNNEEDRIRSGRNIAEKEDNSLKCPDCGHKTKGELNTPL